MSIELLGTAFEVRSEDPRIADLLETLWAPFLPPVTAPNREVSQGVHIEVRFDQVEARWTLCLPGEEPLEESDPWHLLDEIRYFMVEEAARRATSTVGLHSGVVGREGSTVLIAGPSGTGKTSLTLAFVEAGWAYGSDDLAPIDSATGEVTPFPKPLGVRVRPGWELQRAKWSLPDWMPEPEETFALPATVLPLLEMAPRMPTAMLFPRFEPGASPKITEISPAAAAARCGQFVHEVTAAKLSVLIELCRLVKVAEITYGSSEAALDTFNEAVVKGGRS